MSSKCACRYLYIDENKFGKYPDATKVQEALNILPALFHQERDYPKVIRLAALLPSPVSEKIIEYLKKNERNLDNMERDTTAIKESNTENLNATLFAIEGSFSNVMMDKPHYEAENVIKFLASYAKTQELGMDYWKNVLYANMLKNKEGAPLSGIMEWYNYAKNIKLLANEFDLPLTELLDRLLIAAGKDQKEHPAECIRALNQWGALVDYSIYLSIADSMMINANKNPRESARSAACEKTVNLYKLIREHKDIGSRNSILDAWQEDKKSDNHQECRKTLRAASAVLKFKYIPRGFFDRFIK